MIKRIITVLLTLAITACGAACSPDKPSKPRTAVEYTRSEDGMIIATPAEDAEIVLHNPDMGWVLYDNYIISKTESPASELCALYGYDFPGVDNVMLKFTWADIEKEQDVYDFEEFDFIYDYWTKRGKTVSVGMSADSLLWYGQYGRGIPDYVIKALPGNKVQNRKYPENQTLTYNTCDANEPFYQKRLEKFLKACDAHFKKSGRTVDYIDLRGYGLWGEWHQGYIYSSLEKKRTALEDVMRIWSESFPDSWLALSYSYDPDDHTKSYSTPGMYEDYLYWSAYDLAMNYGNITLRRDGAGGAVQYNERIFCSDVFSTLSRGPFTSEGAGGYDGREGAERILKDGLTLHPNYFTIIGWANMQALEFITIETDLFEQGLREMGYRFVVSEFKYNETLKAGKEAAFISSWANRAVGRAERDYGLYAVLANENGKVMYEFPLGSSGCSQWVKGMDYTLELKTEIPKNVRKGDYKLGIRMVDKKTGRDIELPLLKACEDDRWYEMGPVTIVK